MENCNLQECKGKNWVATLLFCWFLGYFGAHRFYTGKSNSAWAMLILSLLGITAPISAIWALIDGITIALGKYRHEDGSELYEKINWLGITYIIVMALSILSFIGLMIFYVAIIAALIGGLGGAANSAITSPTITP